MHSSQALYRVARFLYVKGAQSDSQRRGDQRDLHLSQSYAWAFSFESRPVERSRPTKRAQNCLLAARSQRCDLGLARLPETLGTRSVETILHLSCQSVKLQKYRSAGTFHIA